jgi:hypothetical protein
LAAGASGQHVSLHKREAGARVSIRKGRKGQDATEVVRLGVYTHQNLLPTRVLSTEGA